MHKRDHNWAFLDSKFWNPFTPKLYILLDSKFMGGYYCIHHILQLFSFRRLLPHCQTRILQLYDSLLRVIIHMQTTLNVVFSVIWYFYNPWQQFWWHFLWICLQVNTFTLSSFIAKMRAYSIGLLTCRCMPTLARPLLCGMMHEIHAIYRNKGCHDMHSCISIMKYCRGWLNCGW